MSSWTLPSELQKLANRSTLPDALETLGLIGSPTEAFVLGEVSEWRRGGAETYLYSFHLTTPSMKCREYLLKACVAFSPQQPLEEILNRWIVRRCLLQKAGVRVPALVTYGHGVLVEEFIPHSLAETLNRSPLDAPAILRNLAEYAGVISALGFMPIDPFSDLRSRGSDIVPVDFGEDLGEPNLARGASNIFSRLLRYLPSLRLDRGAEEELRLWETFALTRERLLTLPLDE